MKVFVVTCMQLGILGGKQGLMARPEVFSSLKGAIEYIIKFRKKIPKDFSNVHVAAEGDFFKLVRSAPKKLVSDIVRIFERENNNSKLFYAIEFLRGDTELWYYKCNIYCCSVK